MSGNGRPKGTPDLAPKIRKAFVNAIKRKGGSEYLQDLMIESLEKDFTGTLNAISKFNPRINNTNETKTLEIKINSEVGTWIEGFNSGIKSLEHSDTPVALEHMPQNTLETVPIDVSESTVTVIDDPQPVVQAGHATIEDEAVG